MVSNEARRRHQRQRVQTRRGIAELFKMAIAVAAVTVIAILVIRFVVQREPAADTFCEGVYVNGLSLGGMSREEGVQAVLDGLDQRLNQDSYVLTYQGKEWVFTPSAFDARLETDIQTQIEKAWNFGHYGSASDKREQAAYVKENPVYYDSTIVYDEAKLEAFLNQIKAEVDIPPVEATVKIGLAEELTVTESRDGRTLDIENLRERLDRAIREGNTASIELEPRVQPPVHSTQDLIDNTQLIAEHRTSTKKSTSNRTKNIARALKSFNGVSVQSGETVSFNEVVGKRTKANGFYKAPEYDGTQLKDGIGGGSCQASTTLYCALLKANIDIVMRSPHSMTVSYTDPSMDAAVSDKKDLRFTNTLDYPIYIYTQVDSEWATVRIYGPRCEYDIVLDYEIVDEKPPQKGKYVDDTSGEIVKYTDERVLKEEGKNMVKSRGYRKYFDRQTQEEIVELRQDLGLDTYYEKQPVYWRGVLERGAEG